MSRTRAIDLATSYFDDGQFMRVLDQRVAQRTESQSATSLPALYAYLTQQIVPELEALGFTWQIIDNPLPGKSPFLIGERIEDPATPTVLTYGHGDVVLGYAEQWRAGCEPWKIVVEGDRWYGRGTADNKGQHTINIAALAQVLEARGGILGFNVKVILEMGEETGSPGLAAVCAQHRDAFCCPPPHNPSACLSLNT